VLTRRQWETIENKILAPYALRASQSRGRVYAEPEHPYRTCFQRDHDRIIHCTAFRRLEYKTQVFVAREGSSYRTRLTHSLEAAQIAETIARVLRLNFDLTRSIALAHDLGHGPFGHAGEDVLRELMRDFGGFDHNLHTLRLVDFLEERYPQFPGLNLSWEIREGLNKHRMQVPGQTPSKQLSLEAQVVDVSDEIAYDHHDLDDGLRSGILKESELMEIPIYRRAADAVARDFAGLPDKMRWVQVIRRLIDWRVTDLLEESEKRLKRYRVRTPESVRGLAVPIVAFSDEMARLRYPLKRILYQRLYHHPSVARTTDQGRRIVRRLFKAYAKNPVLLPPAVRARQKIEDPHRVICDYIAGMTDRFAVQSYQRIFHCDAPF
jgi:dGTPase